MDHTLHSKKLSQKMQTAFKNKQSHTMALKQTSDFNKYCHIVKAQSIDITYLSRHCVWLERTSRKQLQASLPAAPRDAKEHSQSVSIQQDKLHSVLFLFTLRLSAKPHIRSRQCSKLVADVDLSKQNVHLKKELNTIYFKWRELWNTQISQKFHSLFPPSVPCIHHLFQLTHLLLMPLL